MRIKEHMDELKGKVVLDTRHICFLDGGIQTVGEVKSMKQLFLNVSDGSMKLIDQPIPTVKEKYGFGGEPVHRCQCGN